MNERTIEWNLGFARAEVEAGLKKLLAESGSAYTYSQTDAETCFQVTLVQGSLEARVQPLASHRSPFNVQATLHRTMLVVTYAGLNAQEEETLKRRLTLTFLRVGG